MQQGIIRRRFLASSSTILVSSIVANMAQAGILEDAEERKELIREQQAKLEYTLQQQQIANQAEAESKRQEVGEYLQHTILFQSADNV